MSAHILSRTMIFKHFCLYSTLLATSPTLLWASGQSGFTGSMSSCPVSRYSPLNYSPPPVFSEDLLETTDVSAEEVQNVNKTVTTFRGNVVIERHQLRLQADEVTHHKETEKLQLDGNIHADTKNMSLNASSGWMNLKTNESEFFDSTYYMPETGLRGKTPFFSVSADQKTILKDTRFSTCPPEKQDWSLQAGWLEMNQSTSTGTAKHAIFRLGGVPVFYFPWIQFPLGEERRSGFLVPGIGSSSSNGLEVRAPIYWNIAPNQDALITPTYLKKRGQMLATEYRYLTRSSRGNLEYEYLNKDKEFNDKRYLLHFDNKSKLSDNLSLSLLANDASDSDYLKDMGSSISVTNATHLERNAKLNYLNGPWTAGIMAQTFQTIDESISINNRPYKRLPQITLKGKDELLEMENSYLLGELNTEWVEFEHESINKAQGSRFNIYPKLSLPIESNAWYIKPTAGYIFTQYDTTDTNGDKLDLENRGLSVLSLDSGLFFERDFSNNSLLQTIEPRLYYLNIPYEDQSSIPVFDTSEQDFSFASLFRENRFNGIDRVGDANQLTVALSSRILDKKNGHELFNISIGQIYYFDEQRVSLNNAINTSKKSDIISEVSGSLNRWRGRATFQWNTDTSTSDKRSIQLSYAASEEAVFNVGYRFFRDPVSELNNLEQTDVSFAWPFAKNYSLLSRWNYSLTDKQDIETLVGLQYESCCWALRLITQRYLRDDTPDPYKTSIMLQFVLKGFGSISDKEAMNTLKYAILGYQPDY
jgi:LPS-assembly protein